MPVYFIQMGEDGAIKIGVASDVKSRLAQLKVGSPEPLRLLGVINGGNKEERIIHKMFSQRRLNGEWFSPDGEIINFIKKYNQCDYAPPSKRGKFGERQITSDNFIKKPPPELPNKKPDEQKKNTATLKRCRGVTRQGKQCNRYCTSDSVFCYDHQSQKDGIPDGWIIEDAPKSPKRRRCNGVNRQGGRCKRYCEGDSDFCYDHQFQENGVPDGWVIQKKQKRASVRCKKNTLAGGQCKNFAVSGDRYCSVHMDRQKKKRRRCKGQKKHGTRCTSIAVDGSDYCDLHQFQANGIPDGWENDGVTCAFVDESGYRCGGNPGKSSEYCYTHRWELKKRDDFIKKIQGGSAAPKDKKPPPPPPKKEEVTIALPKDILEKPLKLLLEEISKQISP